MGTLLELNQVYTNIGDYQILQGVDLTVPEHAVSVLLGRNGAGKSTTLRTVMGYWKARSGSIEFRGHSLLGLPTHRVARLGLGYLPEERQVFANLTVRENLELAGRKDEERRQRTEYALTLFPDLRVAWKRAAGMLSGGQKQMLAMARLIVSAPSMLLSDEPSKGLSPVLVQKLAEVLEVMKKVSTILLVEQNFQLASRVGDYFSIIDDGRTCLSGQMEELAGNSDWQRQYLGLEAVKGEGVRQWRSF